MVDKEHNLKIEMIETRRRTELDEIEEKVRMILDSKNLKIKEMESKVKDAELRAKAAEAFIARLDESFEEKAQHTGNRTHAKPILS